MFSSIELDKKIIFHVEATVLENFTEKRQK